MPETPKSEILPDARPDNWVDRFAPEGLRPWLKLGRFDRPTGIWLLMLPGWQGAALAASMAGRWPDLVLLAKIFVGAALMRAAGCAYNDIIDRDLDTKVARTAGRPVASGRISVRQAVVFLVVCSLAAAAILFTLPPLAIGLGVGSLLLVAAYPFMKRITWWPQAWLGLTFNWGALLGFAAVTGEIGLPAVLLYLGGVFWTLGYDTIYAVQDLEDDALAGIRSSARRLGRSAPKAVLGAYILAFLLALACAFTARLGPLFPPLAAGYGLILSRQAARLDMDDPAGALTLFRANALAGLVLFAALAAGQFGQGLWGGGGL
ncbi:4-hydroxybenzoate octaprenyltransferase [Phenylobacterium sp.]|jgi:4-hydroxybenzoate polyprenyltransferase|uniref:4-hydroxybenzoate octaprenyltransferase n=1 Tax=Phenylobacterium sp. TaxID=1871053 RepID=UPI0037C690A1